MTYLNVVNVCLTVSCESCTCLVSEFSGKLDVWKFINCYDVIEKVFTLHVFHNVIMVFQIKNENENQHSNHNQGGLMYIIQKIWKFCKKTQSRPTVLNTKMNLQQCPPNQLLPNPAQFFRTILNRIRHVLLMDKKIQNIREGTETTQSICTGVHAVPIYME